MIKIDESNFQLVLEASTEVFSNLVDLSGLDPATDFQYMDLSDIDFKDSDLREFRFKGSKLDGCDLSKTIVGPWTLEGVTSLRGATLPIADEDYFVYEHTTITLRLNDLDRVRAIKYFGSLRHAVMLPIAAIGDTTHRELGELLRVNRKNKLLSANVTSKKSHVSLPIRDVDKLRSLKAETGVPVTIILRILLKVAIASVHQPLEIELYITDKDFFSIYTRLLRNLEKSYHNGNNYDEQQELPF